MKNEEAYPTYQALVNDQAKGGGAEILVVVEREGTQIRFHSRGEDVNDAFGNINFNMHQAYHDVRVIKDDLTRIRKERDYVQTDQPINPSKMSNFQRDALKKWNLKKLNQQMDIEHRLAGLKVRGENDDAQTVIKSITSISLSINLMDMSDTERLRYKKIMERIGGEMQRQMNIFPSRHEPLALQRDHLIIFLEDLMKEHERRNYPDPYTGSLEK